MMMGSNLMADFLQFFFPSEPKHILLESRDLALEGWLARNGFWGVEERSHGFRNFCGSEFYHLTSLPTAAAAVTVGFLQAASQPASQPTCRKLDFFLSEIFSNRKHFPGFSLLAKGTHPKVLEKIGQVQANC